MPAAPVLGIVLGYTAYRGSKKLTDSDKNDQIDTLARTVWAEARGEGSQGMHAICNVVMNRVKANSWWGKTPKEVCLKKSQFSCWNKSDPNYSKLIAVTESDKNFKTAKQLATAAVNGSLFDITNGATNYLALKSLKTVPSWVNDMKVVANIGNHTFYA